MTMTTYLADKFLDHVLGVAAYTAPGTVWAAPHIGNPTDTGAASPATETTRKAVSFAAASGKSSSATGTPISWTGLAATETWTHIVFHDASTGGNPLLYEALVAPANVTIGGSADLTSATVTAT